MADSWKFFARDQAAFREWQAYYSARDPNREPPAQPQWVRITDTMPAETPRAKVRSHVLKLSETHGIVRAEYGRHEIAVFKHYIVEKTPRDMTGAP